MKEISPTILAISKLCQVQHLMLDWTQCPQLWVRNLIVMLLMSAPTCKKLLSGKTLKIVPKPWQPIETLYHLLTLYLMKAKVRIRVPITRIVFRPKNINKLLAHNLCQVKINNSKIYHRRLAQKSKWIQIVSLIIHSQWVSIYRIHLQKVQFNQLQSKPSHLKQMK